MIIEQWGRLLHVAGRKVEKEERWSRDTPQHVSARERQLASLPGAAGWGENDCCFKAVGGGGGK